ncbi:hypothetical protein MA5S0921_0660 [Mycobacteroides abscessus 5S-0921]|uniref:Uncharacterized protein n=1 Tax=Mycobacteroides abscessus subsp. bolletii 1513 TaxID=1299321 RepID=X8E0A4_9MYCO|nr:hypothetical protein MA5S0921_0660 [Mycobacteroides abscessus 5S-0921]EUA73681.1 hypothetical protein I540_0601 [Mycobacteroides abscessus subsp. bolletii 1513]
MSRTLSGDCRNPTSRVSSVSRANVQEISAILAIDLARPSDIPKSLARQAASS